MLNAIIHYIIKKCRTIANAAFAAPFASSLIGAQKNVRKFFPDVSAWRVCMLFFVEVDDGFCRFHALGCALSAFES